MASPLRQVPLRQVNIQGSPLRQVPLRQVDFQASPLRQVPLRQVDIQGSPLRQVPLRQVANLSAIVNCAAVDCGSQTLTLGDVPVDALIGTLGALVGSVPSDVDLGTLGELGGPDYPDAYGAADAALTRHAGRARRVLRRHHARRHRRAWLRERLSATPRSTTSWPC